MRSTGSKSVRATDVFVPEHRALCMYQARGGSEFPGASANPGALYRVPIGAISSHCLAAAGVGNAQAALELTTEAIKERSTSYTAARMRDFQAVQLRVARAGAQIDAARLICRADCLEAQGVAEQGRLMTIEDKLRCRRNVAYAMELCTDALDSLHALAGANGIYDRYPIKRLFLAQHALAANAGIFPRVDFLQMTEAQWDEVLDVNLKGTFLCTQAAAREMVERGRGGAVVNLASGAAFRSSPRGVHYVASKAGIVGVTRAAALELASHKIRVNAIAPGLTDTAQPCYGMSEEELQAAGWLHPSLVPIFSTR